WQSRFGGLPSALGAVLHLDDRAFTIVGVMPPQYAFPYEAQVWVPFVLNTADSARDFAVFAHVTPAAADRQVADALTAVAADRRRLDHAADRVAHSARPERSARAHGPANRLARHALRDGRVDHVRDRRRPGTGIRQLAERSAKRPDGWRTRVDGGTAGPPPLRD